MYQGRCEFGKIEIYFTFSSNTNMNIHNINTDPNTAIYIMWCVALFDMPNSNRFDILSISIFSEISLSISIFSKISLSIFSRTALSISISIFSRIALSISIFCKIHLSVSIFNRMALSMSIF